MKPGGKLIAVTRWNDTELALKWNFAPEHRHAKNFAPGWYFQFQPGLKKIGVTREFQPEAKQIFFYFISPQGKNIFAKICGIFYKNVLQKETFRMQLQEYIKTMMLDFINKRSEMFNFKMLLLATIQKLWQPRFY